MLSLKLILFGLEREVDILDNVDDFVIYYNPVLLPLFFLFLLLGAFIQFIVLQDLDVIVHAIAHAVYQVEETSEQPGEDLVESVERV